MKKAIFAGLLLALTGATLAQVDPARVVATVNGVAIKGDEYYHRMEFLPGVGKNMGDGFAEFPPGFLTLEQLITEKLVFQLAKDKGVMPTQAEIDAELQYRMSKDKTLRVDWLASGRTDADLQYQVKFDLAQFKILTAGITVTDTEVDDYYEKNKLRFTIPQQVTLRVIVVRSKADEDAVDKELAAGKPFADVAKAHSADVTAGTGGEYGTVPVTRLAEAVRTAILAIKPGQTTDWFGAGKDPESTDGPAAFKFLLEKSVPPTVIPMSPDLRRQARQQVMMDKGKMRNHVKEELDALRAKANIDISQKSFAEAYKKFLDASLKAKGKG